MSRSGCRSTPRLHRRRSSAACRPPRRCCECHNITGTVAYLLRVEARDLPAYKQFHTDYLGAFPYLQTLTTMVVTDSPKDARA